MTKAQSKDAATKVVIPTAVALALIALATQVYGALVKDDSDRRITALETRYIELERQQREKWDMTMEKLAIIQSQLSRLEGKLDK